ncbi:MAG: hypothetical protein AB2A00_09610 [Myxococcota bacterium]
MGTSGHGALGLLVLVGCAVVPGNHPVSSECGELGTLADACYVFIEPGITRWCVASDNDAPDGWSTSACKRTLRENDRRCWSDALCMNRVSSCQVAMASAPAGCAARREVLRTHDDCTSMCNVPGALLEVVEKSGE